MSEIPPENNVKRSLWLERSVKACFLLIVMAIEGFLHKGANKNCFEIDLYLL